MPLIDRLIKTIRKYQADELVVATGEKVILSVGSARRPVSAEAATRQQVEVLLREIVPGDLASRVREEGTHEFPYVSPSGSVRIQVERNDGGLRIRAIPVQADDGGAPAAPLASSSALDSGVPDPRKAASGQEASPRSGPAEEARPAAPSGPVAGPAHLADMPAAAGDTAVFHPVAAATELSPDRPEEVEAAPPAAETAAGPAKDAPLPVAETARPAAAGAEIPSAPAATPDSAEAAATEAAGAKGSQAMEDLFMRMIQEGCSDLHLCVGNPPLFRKDGDIAPLGDDGPMTEGQVRDLVFPITPRVKREEFEARHDTDFAHEIPGVARFRCNLFLDRMGVGGVFRLIPSRIPTPEELGLSRPILQLCELPKGLVLVTGPTGSGKSTTLAALVDQINRSRTAHIITIEDPIEFVHANQKCLINQREVGTHTEGFRDALRAALREDPDCVLVGEMRDLETIALAIETAETGHLVFATLHTSTAATTVDRMIDQFPADRQSQIRAMLSESLKGVISQTLCKKRGGGRVAALEVLLVTAAVSNLIREGKAFQIPSIMQTGKGLGMATLNDALLELVQKGTVSPKEAYFRAVAKTDFKTLLERNSFKVDAA